MGGLSLQIILVIAAITILTAAHILAAMCTAQSAECFGGRAPLRRFPRRVLEFSAAAPAPLDYGLFETVAASAHSSLMPWHLRSLQAALRHEFGAAPPRTVVDATAHVGVDAANFFVTFPGAAVTALEIDPAVAAAARRNLARVARAAGRAPPEVRAADGAAFVRGLGRPGAPPPPDLLYLDPPWGGGGAALAAADAAVRRRRLNLELGGEPLAAVVAAALRGGAGAVAAKLPRESDTAAFAAAVAAAADAPVRTAAHAVCDERRSSAAPAGAALPAAGAAGAPAACAAGAPVGYWLTVSRLA